MKTHFLFSSFLASMFLLASCSKNKSIETSYTGVVKRYSDECTGSKGKPMIVKIFNSSEYDSIYTYSLPEEYKTAGKELRFNMRKHEEKDGGILCVATVMNPKFMVLYDVISN